MSDSLRTPRTAARTGFPRILPSRIGGGPGPRPGSEGWNPEGRGGASVGPWWDGSDGGMASGGGTGAGPRARSAESADEGGAKRPAPPSRTAPAQPRSAQSATHPRAISAAGVHPLPPNAFDLQISSFKKSDGKKKKKSDGLCSRLWTLSNGLP